MPLSPLHCHHVIPGTPAPAGPTGGRLSVHPAACRVCAQGWQVIAGVRGSVRTVNLQGTGDPFPVSPGAGNGVTAGREGGQCSL
ncbi:hypothetical protein ABMT19_004326 [Salmonella enterica subsp. enterica serovar Newport]